MGHPFPDSDSASSDPINLTKEWKEYSIDLTNKDLSHIIGGFGWVGLQKKISPTLHFIRPIFIIFNVS